MANRDEFNHQVRRTTITTVGFIAGLVFGIILLASGDWIPGGIIVAATIVGLEWRSPSCGDFAAQNCRLRRRRADRSANTMPRSRLGRFTVSSASRGVRVAAVIVCAVFTAFVLIHLVWAAGVTWGLKEVGGGGPTNASIALTVISLIAAAVACGAIIVTRSWSHVRTRGHTLAEHRGLRSRADLSPIEHSQPRAPGSTAA